MQKKAKQNKTVTEKTKKKVIIIITGKAEDRWWKQEWEKDKEEVKCCSKMPQMRIFGKKEGKKKKMTRASNNSVWGVKRDKRKRQTELGEDLKKEEV